MKLGTENRKATVAGVVLMVIALVLCVRMLLPSSATPNAVVSGNRPTTASAPAAVPARRAGRDARAKHLASLIPPTLDPRLRLELLKESEEVKYEGSGRNIFREHLEDIPRPKAPGLIEGRKFAPPTEPLPPPINLKFYGWASKPGEPKAIFLAQGSEVFVATEGETIARRYKVVKINNNSVEIEDLLSNNKQSIPLTG